jgi:trans-aconitate methyltransferase
MPEWLASDYSQQSSLQLAMAQEQLSRLTLEGGERVLDVGCGDGKITAQIAARAPRGSVVGVDPSHDMIAFASSHFSAHPNLRFEVADARKLPYQNEFDLVVSFNALHWVPQQDQALAAIHASLKPAGRALLRMVPNGARESLEDVIDAVRQAPRWASYFTKFQRPYLHLMPEDYRALAERIGFRVVRLQVDDKAWDFHTREAFVAFARATFVEWTQHLPQDVRDEFILDVLDKYAAVAASNAAEANVFKFYQMEVELQRSS